ncbi:MAG: hypothetical protein AAF645_16380 [Myxococcota bacterium]
MLRWLLVSLMWCASVGGVLAQDVTTNVRIRVELGPVPPPPSGGAATEIAPDAAPQAAPDAATQPARGRGETVIIRAEANATVSGAAPAGQPVLIPALTPPPLPGGAQATDSEYPSFRLRRPRVRGPRLRLGGPIAMICAGATMAATGFVVWDESAYESTYGYGPRDPDPIYIAPMVAGVALGIGGIAFLFRRIFERRRARRAQQRLQLRGASSSSLTFAF